VQSGNTCDNACAANYGVTDGGTTCVACDSLCVACAYVATNCSSCQSSGNGSSFLMFVNATYSECILACPASYLQNTASRSCDPCNTTCSACSNNTNYCTTCVAPLLMLNHTCLAACPNKYYSSGSNCNPCSSKCQLCEGTSTNCSKCTTSGGNKAYLLNNSCLTTCPVKYYEYDNAGAGPTQCLACSAECGDCYQFAANCLDCANGYYLYGGQCITTCPFGYYPSDPSQTCNDTLEISASMNLSMYFPSATEDTIYVDLDFNRPLDQATFDTASFQSFSFS
jgi:hypothetical protein